MGLSGETSLSLEWLARRIMSENMRVTVKEIGGITFVIKSPIIGTDEDKKAICEKVKTLILNKLKSSEKHR